MRPPAPLTERRNVLFRFFITGQLLRSLLGEALAPTGLRQDEFGVESAIGAFGPITPTELAALLGMPPTTLSAYVKRLSDRGEIGQQPNPNDGRSYLLELTPKGRELVREAAPKLRETLERLAGEGLDMDAAEQALAELERSARAALDAGTTKR
jgi:DNA-binding MarR family transcriptional regulator